jgi:hypothetical protein
MGSSHDDDDFDSLPCHACMCGMEKGTHVLRNDVCVVN